MKQTVGIKEAEAGMRVGKPCRKDRNGDQTYYRGGKKNRGMDAGDAVRLKTLDDENRKLKMIVAEQALDIRVLKDVTSRAWCELPASRGSLERRPTANDLPLAAAVRGVAFADCPPR